MNNMIVNGGTDFISRDSNCFPLYASCMYICWRSIEYNEALAMKVS